MFFKKRIKSENPEDSPKATVRKKKHLVRRIFKYCCLFLFFIFLAISIGGWWLCQTEQGHKFIIEEANKFLAPPKDSQALAFRLTSLSGSLPFNFKIGLEASDAHGVWLKAPDNTFTLEWTKLPSLLQISKLCLNNIDLSRFPETPDTEEKTEASTPFGVKDLQDLLRESHNFLSQKHWWLPKVKLDGIEIKNALLPPGLLPSEKGDASKRLLANLGLTASLLENTCQLNISSSIQDSENGSVSLPSFSFHKLTLDSDLNIKPENSLLNALLNLHLNIIDSGLAVKDLPSDLLGKNINLALNAEAKADTNPENPSFAVNITGPNLAAGHLNLTNKAQWQSGQEWKNGIIDGTAAYTMDTVLNPLLESFIKDHPDSPLAMLRKAVKLNLQADASLPKANVTISLTAPEIEVSAHNLSNLSLQIATRDLDLPLPPAGFALLYKEHHCDLKFSGLVDQDAVSLDSQAWFQARELPEKSAQDNGDEKKELAWLAGLKNIDLSALGLTANGNIQAFALPDNKPALNGNLQLELADWKAIQKFIPDQNLSGHIKMDIHLANETDINSGQNRNPSPQNALINLDIPNFSMRPKNGGQPIAVTNLRSHMDLTNVFISPGLDLILKAGQIQAEGMKLNADIKANGPISGPLNAEIYTKGDVNTSLAASWSPGEACLKKCDISLNLPASLSPSGKTAPLGVKSAGQALIHYGEKGIGIKNLDLRITPSGRLQVNGGLAPDKLSFKINLISVDFKPWQILAPQIPLGFANLNVNLNGTPQAPKGNFNLELKDLTLPGNQFPPFGLTLNGAIENLASGSALVLNLNMDKKSLKALGCDKSRISARIPLVFNKEGIPNINMTGPLAANIIWDGALGPIWNLLPMPDMRLNGRIGLDVKAEGTVKAPRIRGGLSINKARYEDLLIGVLLTDINLKADLSESGNMKNTAGALDNLPGAIKLALSAGDGRGGKVTINGKASIDGNNIDINANINKLRPLRRRDIFIEVSGDASVTGSATAPVIRGGLLVNQGEILLNNLEIMSSVTTLPISTGKPEKRPEPVKKVEAKKEGGGGSINFKIDMLPRFTVEGRGLTSIWTAHLLVSGSPFNPSITGDISSVRGNFDFLGKIFSLTKGIVFFGGGALSNPIINMELTNETPDLTAHIIVSGPVNKIQIKLTSDPELPRDEIISQVLFGRSVGDLNRFEALQLAAGVAQLAGLGSSDNFLSSAKKALGLDVLRLGTSPNQAGEPGDMGAGGTTIEMGKYINDMIYMGVQQGLKGDSTAFIIQLELTPHTSLEIRSEDNNTWGGWKWKYNY